LSWFRTTALVGAMACASFGARAAGTDLVTDGTFANNLAAWTVATSTNGNTATGVCGFNQVTAPGTETLTGEAGFPATDGATAVLGGASVTSLGYNSCVLYQDITIPAGALTATLSADVGKKVTGAQSASNTVVDIGIYPTTSVPKFTDTPYGTNAARIRVGSENGTTLDPRATTPASFNVSAWAGQTVRLAIINAVQSTGGGGGAPPGSGAAIAGIDNIKFVVTVTNFNLTITKAGTGSGTVTADSGAIACGATCTDSYGGGTTVNLTALADAGSTFAGWSGDCAGATTTVAVSMSAAKTCTATFDPAGTPPAPTPTPPAPVIPQLPVNIDTTGSGQGTVSLSAALSSLPANTPISVQQTSGAALPSWLTFDPQTRSFTYDVPLPSDLPIQPVTAGADVRAAKAARAAVPNRVYPLSVLVQNVPILLTAGAVQYIVNMDFYAPRSPVAITALSYSAAGRSGNAASGKPAMSWDGGQVLFETAATNVYPAFSNQTMVGRYHGLSGNRDLLSQTAIPGGGVANAIDGPANAPAVSADGSFGAFSAAALSVAENASSPLRQIYRTVLNYPRVSLNQGATPPAVMVSTTPAGVPANAAADKPALSQDGAFVAFESAATNLGMNRSATTQIFRKNMADGSVSIVSTTAAGEAGNGDSRNVSLSWDGRFAAFDSTATNLVPGVSGRQVYLKDLATNAIFVISASAGVAGNQPSVAPKLDARATSIVFASQATNLGLSAGMYWQVLRFDTATGALTLVSATPAGRAGNQDSDQPTVSADGRFIAWRSAANDLGTTPVYGSPTQIWVRDVFRGQTVLVTQTDVGLPGGGNSYDPALSGDGASIAFGSQARDLVNGNPLPGQIHLAANPLVLPARTAHWYAPAGGNQAWTIERWGNKAYIANLAYAANGGAGTWVSGFCTVEGLNCTGTLNQVTGGSAAVRAVSSGSIGTVAMTFSADGTQAQLAVNGGPLQSLKLYPVLGPSITGFAGLPQGGWWWEAADAAGANGVFLQFGTQNGSNGALNQAAHLSLLSYDANGSPVWYAAEGVLGRDGSLEATLYRYAGGAPVGQAVGSLTPSSVAVGTVRLSFAGTDRASLRLPDGRTATLGRFRF